MKTVPLLLVIAVITPWLTACGRVVYEWQGPTDNFRGLDANSDGDVDRFEWERVHGSVFDKSQGFRFADCDSNGRMSWHEYFVGYMGMQHCPGRYLYEPPPSPPPAAGTGYDAAYASYEDDGQPDNWFQGTLLVRPDENLQIYEQLPEGPDMPTLARPRLRPPPARYSEEDLPPAAQQRLRVTSGKLADAVLVSHYDPVEKIPGNEAQAAYPHVSCDIANDNGDVRITLADIEVAWRAGGRESRERWLKPLWIEPGSSQHLDVWFGSAVDAAECRLLNARGQVVR